MDERLKRLFADCDPEIRKLITAVIAIEQQHISMERPRIKDDLDALISLVAREQGRNALGEG